jgi:hypothetical protein
MAIGTATRSQRIISKLKLNLNKKGSVIPQSLFIFNGQNHPFNPLNQFTKRTVSGWIRVSE